MHSETHLSLSHSGVLFIRHLLRQASRTGRGGSCYSALRCPCAVVACCLFHTFRASFIFVGYSTKALYLPPSHCDHNFKIFSFMKQLTRIAYAVSGPWFFSVPILIQRRAPVPPRALARPPLVPLCANIDRHHHCLWVCRTFLVTSPARP